MHIRVFAYDWLPYLIEGPGLRCFGSSRVTWKVDVSSIYLQDDLFLSFESKWSLKLKIEEPGLRFDV